MKIMPQFDSYSYCYQIILLLLSFWFSYFLLLIFFMLPILKSLKLRQRVLINNFNKLKNNVCVQMQQA